MLPSTGIVATTRSVETSSSSMPIFSFSPPMPWGIEATYCSTSISLMGST